MYYFLLSLHSLMRWLVLGALVLAILIATRGYLFRLPWTPTANRVRHWTATIAHTQLLLGILLYTQSPVVRGYLGGTGSPGSGDARFFSVIHLLLMLAALVLITIGSAMAKRQSPARQQFRTLLLYYTTALLLILAAIPWPFHPLAKRPLARPLSTYSITNQ